MFNPNFLFILFFVCCQQMALNTLRDHQLKDRANGPHFWPSIYKSLDVKGPHGKKFFNTSKAKVGPSTHTCLDGGIILRGGLSIPDDQLDWFYREYQKSIVNGEVVFMDEKA